MEFVQTKVGLNPAIAIPNPAQLIAKEVGPVGVRVPPVAMGEHRLDII